MNNQSFTPDSPPKVKKKRIRGIFKRYFNPKRWLGTERIGDFGKLIRENAHVILARKTATRSETFDEAVLRLGLTEQDIVNKTKQFFLLAIVYLFLSIGAFLYGIYLLISGSFLAGFLSLVLTAFIGSNALKEHFWYMQMKQRRLGCNLQDWLHFLLYKTTTIQTRDFNSKQAVENQNKNNSSESQSK